MSFWGEYLFLWGKNNSESSTFTISCFSMLYLLLGCWETFDSWTGVKPQLLFSIVIITYFEQNYSFFLKLRTLFNYPAWVNFYERLAVYELILWTKKISFNFIISVKPFALYQSFGHLQLSYMNRFHCLIFQHTRAKNLHHDHW